MEVGPSRMVPTPTLIKDRLNLINQLRLLPFETQFNILTHMEDKELLNVCLIDTEMLNLCWDPYIKTLKNWSNKEFIIFKLCLLSRCNYKECKILKDELNNELINDGKFMFNYKLIVENRNIKYDNLTKPINILLNTNKIVFDDEFDIQIDLRYFINLTHLTFGDFYNQSVDKVVKISNGSSVYKSILPNSITHLIFGYWFNKSVNHLPNSITHLTFGRHFNQPVDNLPNSITHLTFIWNFDQPVDKLPNSITHLTFGRNFDQQLTKLPTNLKYLVMSSTYKYLYQLQLILPHSVELVLNKKSSLIYYCNITIIYYKLALLTNSSIVPIYIIVHLTVYYLLQLSIISALIFYYYFFLYQDQF